MWFAIKIHLFLLEISIKLEDIEMLLAYDMDRRQLFEFRNWKQVKRRRGRLTETARLGFCSIKPNVEINQHEKSFKKV